jgi:hypothetical protein
MNLDSKEKRAVLKKITMREAKNGSKGTRN